MGLANHRWYSLPPTAKQQQLSFEAAKEEAQSALVKAEKVNRDLAAAKKASTATPVGGVKQQVAKVRATLPPRGERAEIRSVVKRIDHPLSGHVLWVDDHPENNEWERRAMELLGLTLTCKASTSEAMRLMIDQGMEFDVVISDMNRNHDGGATAGYGLARKLRANKYINPIIIYTYWDDKPALEQTGQADVETARQPAKLPAEHADEQAAGEPSPQDLAPMAIIRSATKLLEAVIRAVKYGV